MSFIIFRHVQRAHKEQAIDTLMLADSLFRAQDIETRKKYVKLVEDVKENVRCSRFFENICLFFLDKNGGVGGAVRCAILLHRQHSWIKILGYCSFIKDFLKRI